MDVDVLRPDGWTLQDNLDSLSLWKSTSGGAITISFVEGAGSAADFCARFAAEHSPDPPRLSGTGEAAFTDHDGVWCKLRVVAAGARMLVASYHASIEDPLEEVEADAILASVRLK